MSPVVALVVLAAGGGARVEAGRPEPAAMAAPNAAKKSAQKSLPFIEDDYARALAEARARKLPLFVDAWAPWCHTCRFMRAHVFTDPSLAKLGGRFVWLAIDTEKEANAAFIEKFPIEVWPTLMVIDPAAEEVALSWAGSANPTQLGKLLEDGERALGRKQGKGPEVLLAKADRLYGRRAPEAIAAYRDVILRADLTWPRRARALESFVMALARKGDLQECATVAGRELPRLPPGPSSANVALMGLGCAVGAPPDAPWRAGAIAGLFEATMAEVKRPGLLADDRSSLYDLLVETAKAQGRPADARALADEWLRFLEGEAAKAPTADARSVFDPHRMSAAIAVGDPARALPPLLQSEKDLPGDYNPPFRLAVVYGELGRYPEALAASDRALGKLYGPRKIRALEIRADILEKKGDKPAARQTMEQALQVWRTLAKAQRSEKTQARIQAAIDKLK